MSNPLVQFYGRDFTQSGIEPNLAIPASLHLVDLTRPQSKEAQRILPNIKLAIITECLGENDEKAGRPLVGNTGTDFRGYAKTAGLPAYRQGEYKNSPFYEIPDIYFDSVVKLCPEENDITQLPPSGLEYWFDVLRRQLQCGILRPNCILAVGPYAAAALLSDEWMGLDKKHRPAGSITKIRGSILETWFDGPDGHPIKVIPTVHPTFIQAQYHLRYQLIHDIKKAYQESAFPDRRVPKYSFIINPTIQEVEDYVDHIKCLESRYEKELSPKNLSLREQQLRIYEGSEPPAVISYDFETKPPYLRSCGYATDEKAAICIPFTGANLQDYWHDPDHEERAWRAHARILQSFIPKMGANFLVYDNFLAYWYGMPVYASWFDTQFAHRILQPELPAGLAKLASIYTDQPFYKDDKDILNFTKEEQDKFWRYNCLDVVCPITISKKIIPDLKDANLWSVYVERGLTLYQSLLLLSLKGIRWDRKFQHDMHEFYMYLQAGLQEHINHLAGRQVNVRSPVQMKDFFYKTKAMVTQFTGKGKSRRVTTDAPAIIRLRNLYPRHAELLTAILYLRSVNTRLSNTIETTIDTDGMVRSSFGMTETGRLSSYSSSLNTGRNLQNLERTIDDSSEAERMRNFLVVDDYTGVQ